MNTKIQCLIDGGFISTNDVLEHAAYLENQMNEYYQEEYGDNNIHEDLYGQDEWESNDPDAPDYEDTQDVEWPFDINSHRSDNPEYIIASTSYRMEETYIFEANEKGEILNYGEYGGLCNRHGDKDWNNRDKTVESVFPGKYERVKDFGEIGELGTNVYHSLYKRK